MPIVTSILSPALLALVASISGCRREQPQARPRPQAEPLSLASALPEVGAPFAAGPLVQTDTFAQRAYLRGTLRLEVTFARMPAAAVSFEQWLTQSRAYPQAPLDLPPDLVNGFYACAGQGGASEACDLKIQMRNGCHVEINSDGHAGPRDLDALAARLPLARLAASPGNPPAEAEAGGVVSAARP
jgi:hypothetical protein